MSSIDMLPPTQQRALRAACFGPLVLRACVYVAEAGVGGDRHPIRTIRALQRADLMREVDARAVLTDAGRAIAEGRA